MLFYLQLPQFESEFSIFSFLALSCTVLLLQLKQLLHAPIEQLNLLLLELLHLLAHLSELSLLPLKHKDSLISFLLRYL